MRRTVTGAVLLPLSLSLLLGCSSAAAKPDPQSAGPSRHEMVDPLADNDDERDGLEVEGTLGTIDGEAAQAGLAQRLPAAEACFRQRAQRQPYLGGKLTLVFRVSRQGTVKKLKLSQSSLGSVEVERCVARGFGGVRFPKPKGGEAEVVYPLSFQSRAPSLTWGSGMVKDEILKNVDTLLLDGEGKVMTAPAGLALTLYVDGKGRVVSAGMTADDAVDDDFADRLIANLKQLKFVAHDQGHAKVSYTW
jgi:hypothetical protein